MVIAVTIEGCIHLPAEQITLEAKRPTVYAFTSGVTLDMTSLNAYSCMCKNALTTAILTHDMLLDGDVGMIFDLPPQHPIDANWLLAAFYSKPSSKLYPRIPTRRVSVGQ